MFCFYSSCFSQQDYIPCIIFVDAKYIQYANCYISYFDSLNQEKQIDLIYNIGKLKWEINELEKILDKKNNSNIKLHIKVFENDQYFNNYDFDYSDFLPIEPFIKKEYLIINILNYNKQKHIYYFDSFSPCSIKKWKWHPDFGSERIAYKKYIRNKKKIFQKKYNHYGNKRKFIYGYPP
jgi:hypothetical protein